MSLQQFFDKYASTHTGDRKPLPSIIRFESKMPTWDSTFGEFLPSDRNSQVLDGGCGAGSLLWWLQHRGYQNAEGVDISGEQIEIAVSLGVKNAHHGHLLSFIEDKQSHYQLIILRDVVEHIPKLEVLPTLKAILNALAPGGCLVLQVPNSESPFFGRIRYGDFTHESAFNSSSLQQLFKMAEFSSVTFRSSPPVFRGYRSIARRILWSFFQWLYKTALYAELGQGQFIVTQNIIVSAKK